MESIANELHKPIRKVKQFRKVIVYRVNEIWACDIVQMDKFNNENNGYKYILTIIDIYSRYAWAIPLKTKSATEVSSAFQNIITKFKVHPEKIYCDQGTEFYNKTMDNLRSKYKIEIYSTFGVAHAAHIERFNRSLKTIMYKQFTINGNHIWYNMLDDLVDKYNNSIHRTIKNKPKDVFKNDLLINNNMIDDRTKTKPNFKVGDRVRISYKRGAFDKGYLVNWSYEIFIINEVLNTKPITYKIKDEKGEIIKGSFYTEELQKTNSKEGIYLVEKILETKITKGKKKHYVKFIGYSDKWNEWIDDKNIKHNLKDIDKL
jgi:hypothetical protein